jgi:esterase/lipase superfamily enzyme
VSAVFECVVCGVCTKDALVYAIPHPTEKVVALCGSYCKRAFRKDASKYLSDHAEHGEGD